MEGRQKGETKDKLREGELCSEEIQFGIYPKSKKPLV